jgi:hypothetical protein
VHGWSMMPGRGFTMVLRDREAAWDTQRAWGALIKIWRSAW